MACKSVQSFSFSHRLLPSGYVASSLSRLPNLRMLAVHGMLSAKDQDQFDSFVGENAKLLSLKMHSHEGISTYLAAVRCRSLTSLTMICAEILH